MTLRLSVLATAASVVRNLSCALLPSLPLLLLLLPVLAHAQQAPPIVSPEILSDGRVTFRLNAPKADEVTLTGEFLDGPRSFAKGADGIWTVTVGPIAPEVYHYNFSIDGVRTIDPANAQLKTGSTASTITSVLEIRHASPAFYDAQPVPHGEIRTHWYHSKSLDATRRLTVYTPPGYDKHRSTRYPVLYLFHGANADENAWYRLGRANLILDNLLATGGKTQPFIVVMPFGYGVPPGGPQADNTAKFGKDLIEDVIPYIDDSYRTISDRTSRAIVGLSMGGGQALSIGLNNIDLFSYVGGFSSGLGNAANYPKTYAKLVANADDANKRLKLLWIGCGREDGQFGQSKSLSDFLTANGVKHTFRETDGAHTWMVWRRYLHEISPLLFR
jgi:enterochelin esterase-like enzyme